MTKNVNKTIEFYNKFLEKTSKENISKENVDEVIRKNNGFDDKNIKWSTTLKNCLIRREKLVFDERKIRLVNYRPFFEQWLYYDKILNHSHYRQDYIHSSSHSENRCIVISTDQEFNCLMVNKLQDHHYINAGIAIPERCCPKNDGHLLDSNKPPDESAIKKSLVNDIKLFYKNEKITHKDVFNYVYGIFHSLGYRAKYKNDLSRAMPKIPIVKKFTDFKAFTQAGSELSDLHINYKTGKKFTELKITKNSENYKIQKMKWRNKEQTALQYNDEITITNIPAKAHEYKINGKSAIWHMVNRYKKSNDEKTGIVNDPNEFFKDPKEILDLFQRVVYVCMKTQEIQEKLPNLEVDMDYYHEETKIIPENETKEILNNHKKKFQSCGNGNGDKR